MADFTLTQAGAELQNLINKIDPTEKKLTKLSGETESKFFELLGNAEIDVPSSSNGWHYYEIPKLKKGQTYTFSLNLAEASTYAIYWTIRMDESTTLFANTLISAGSLESQVTKEVNQEYTKFELGVYSGANVPAISFGLATSETFFSKLQKDISNTEIKANSALTFAQQNTNKIEDIFERKVGTLYKDAWVRYSDGLISDSSGGAKAYIIKRSEIAIATKVYARVCTQHADFAAIAFYSEDTPSTASYIKDSSVEGKSSNALNDFEATIPSNCKSIVVLNMSQLQTDYDIRVNESLFIARNEGAAVSVDAEPLFNPFIVKNQYYHFNQETSSAETYIPAQSLFDVAMAARLGFEMIEVNAQPCSDGVFICKHGSAGKFGAGIKSNNGVDYSSVSINSITSAEVREHITYDSRIPKYNVPIPTLDEFCKECKKHNMSVKANYVYGLLPLLRKYFTDDKIFISGLQTRGDFKGLVEVVYYPSNGMADLDEKCQKVGYPLQIIIASGQFESMSDDAVMDVINYAHQHSYTVAVPYLSSMNWMRAQRLGVDVNLSCERTINSFLIGNDKNISSLSDSGIALSGSASYNADTDTIVMARNSILTISADNIRFGAVSADICYDGMVTIQIGHGKGIHSFVDIESDGNDVFSAAQAILPQNGEETTNFYIKIYAKEDNTIIKDLSIRCSKL